MPGSGVRVPPGFADKSLRLPEKEVIDAKPVDPKLERLELEFWLTEVREYLTADASETKLMLGKDSPEELSTRVASSRLIDPAYRKQLWEGGQATIDACDDPLIRHVDLFPGNSGSPLINAKGEVIGAVFDGNVYMLGGAFAYVGRLNRAVTVSTAEITEALEKVYDDPVLVKELTTR